MTIQICQYITDDPLEDICGLNVCFQAVRDLMDPCGMDNNARGRVAILLALLSDLQDHAFRRAYAERLILRH